MINYIIRRILQAIVSIFILLTILFFLMNLLPGDAALLAGDLRMAKDQETIERVREKWGLNDPVHIRYFRYMSNILKGDFGVSYRASDSVVKLVIPRLISTLKIVSTAFVIASMTGIMMGFIAAIHRNSLIDIFLMVLAILGISMPRFWLGLMLIILFAINLGILPASGMGDGSFIFIILPSLTLSIPMIALVARTTRSSILDVLHHDYIRTARSKGLANRIVYFKHVFRNALLPIVTIVGLQLGTILANTVVVEKVFAWPGIGNLIVDSIFQRDIPLIQGCVFIFALSFIIINLTIDVLYGFLDPNISYN